MKALSEDNQLKERLLNDTISYKFLFNRILIAPDCPHKFKNDVIKPQPYSIYNEKDVMLHGPLLQFVTELISLPVFASGRIDAAYDELFGAPSVAK